MNADNSLRFPENFLWGTATAAFQIEGAASTDGKGENIWDYFCAHSGKVKEGHSGEIACDHYNRLDEDVALMKELGAQVYRFSISWSRLIPAQGKVNRPGVEFYRRLLNKLKENNIRPFVTLYHWDLPQWIQELGGWQDRKILDYFSDYANLVLRELGDLIDDYIVLNEPSVHAFVAHYQGVHAPGIESKEAMFKTIHHQNLVHGQTARLIKEKFPEARVGTTYTHFPIYPAGPSKEDKYAADLMDAVWSRVYFEPLFNGRYPEIVADQIAPYIQPGDLEICNFEGDFIGMNHYCPDYATISDDSLGAKLTYAHDAVEIKESETTDLGWPIAPDELYKSLLDLHQNYNPKSIIITEGGCAFNDVVENGNVHDPKRIDYYKKYLGAVHKAIKDGIPVNGYFAWTLMDNMEWAEGYSARFGLIFTDYENGLTRIPKDSFAWFKKVVVDNGF